MNQVIEAVKVIFLVAVGGKSAIVEHVEENEYVHL